MGEKSKTELSSEAIQKALKSLPVVDLPKYRVPKCSWLWYSLSELAPLLDLRPEILWGEYLIETVRNMKSPEAKTAFKPLYAACLPTGQCSVFELWDIKKGVSIDIVQISASALLVPSGWCQKTLERRRRFGNLLLEVIESFRGNFETNQDWRLRESRKLATWLETIPFAELERLITTVRNFHPEMLVLLSKTSENLLRLSVGTMWEYDVAHWYLENAEGKTRATW